MPTTILLFVLNGKYIKNINKLALYHCFLANMQGLANVLTFKTLQYYSAKDNNCYGVFEQIFCLS